MKKLSLGKLEMTGIQLFVIMLIANGCSYLFQIVTGKMMSIEEYGIMNSLMAFISIVNSPGSVLAAVATKYLAEIKKTKEEIGGIWNAIFNITLLAQSILLIMIYPICSYIAEIMCISEKKLVAYALIISVVSMTVVVGTGALQGLQNYFHYGMQSVVMYVVQLLLSIVLLKCHFEIKGVLVAILVANVISGIYACSHLNLELRAYQIRIRSTIMYLRKWKTYIISTFFAKIAILVLLNMDTLIIKRFFSDYVTGIYSSGMVIAKIGMYLATAIVVPLFPMAVEEQGNKKKIILFLKAFLYGVGACVGYSMCLMCFKNYIIAFVFGEKYLESTIILGYLCSYVIIITGLLIVMNYNLAKDKSRVFSVTIYTGIVIALGLISIIHSSIERVMLILTVVFGIVLVLNILYIVGMYIKKSRY